MRSLEACSQVISRRSLHSCSTTTDFFLHSSAKLLADKRLNHFWHIWSPTSIANCAHRFSLWLVNRFGFWRTFKNYMFPLCLVLSQIQAIAIQSDGTARILENWFLNRSSVSLQWMKTAKSMRMTWIIFSSSSCYRLRRYCDRKQRRLQAKQPIW